MTMDMIISNLCGEIYEKLTNNLAYFEEMLKITIQLESKSLDTEVEFYLQSVEQREKLIHEIDLENQAINVLLNKIAQRTGLKDFKFESVQAYIPEEQYENLTNLHVVTQKVILQIQDLDREYSQKIGLAKEATALNLHRISNINRQLKSYQRVDGHEARFIDKNR